MPALDPFQLVRDVRLESGDGGDYIFAGTLKNAPLPCRLTIEKGTGFLKRVEMGSPEKVVSTVTITDVHPDPGFKDDIFVFPKIDPAIQVKDNTEDLIRAGKP